MNKIGAVIVVIVMVFVVYLFMLVVMPVVADLANTANTTMQASSNMSLYPGAAEGVVSAPWVMWFAPAVVGMTAIIIILKRP